ncbi:MAG TPA: DNA translocase FtsK 4TM domain-containing protein [Candidatus Binatia bacterium]|jgi:S-DNA-T family DNA segregation ATPase FtsK/SpoIIIE|nr:DNA translocase FtsK 4TM domain-containing protein [Candidatus Binatia bacterium]
MAAGRKPQLQERAFGDEVIGVACAALAVFFILAFYSYHPGDAQPNQMGLVGHVVADLVCPMLGKACYLLPAALLYGTAVLLHLLPFPAPFSQMVSFLFFIPAAATFLALWCEGPQVRVVDAGGWVGGFLALHLRVGLDRQGAYVALFPLLLVSFMGITRLSLQWVGAGISGGVLALFRRSWAAVVGMCRLLLFWRRSSEPESSPSKSRSSRKENASKKGLAQPSAQGDEEEEEKLPPIIISRPAPPAAPAKSTQEKRPIVKPPIESAGNGKPYVFPPIPLLDPPVRLAVKVDEDALHASSRILESKLGDFGVAGNVVAVRPGPVITTYEFEPAPGVKVNRVVSLADDLQMALRAVSVRILAPIPGKAVVGIEVSNPRREKVCLREILDSPGFQQSESPLTLALGKDTVGNAIVADLARMPHLLVAGATGTGKSVSLNVMIMSLLYRASPRDVRFIMIDPKMLELSLYEELPQQLSHVITNPKEAGAALQEVVRRMEYRYKLLKDKGVRNIAAYNRALETGQPGPKGVIKLTEVVQDGEEEDGAPVAPRVIGTEPGLSHQRLPYLVVIVDELADLMLTVGREIEEPITRLAQMGRAAGIHLILATQRPSVDVITGLIKANFPARVSFQVSSRVDSRTILDAIGAERLLGEGDMLFLPPGSAKPQRIHGAYVSEPEIRKVAAHIKKQGKPMYDPEFVAALEKARSEKSGDGGMEEDDYDEMYEQARELVMESRQASISWLQRRLRVGYNRAARMIERMEREGLIAPAAEAGKPREVLVQAGRRD